MATRHEQRKAATHQNLIDAARAVIAEKGYNHVDILDITDRANVSKATFYKHFPNKETCVRELMEQGFDGLVEQIMSVKCLPAMTAEWSQNSLEQVFRWADANREFLLIMVGGAASTQLNAFGRSYMAEVVERTITSEFVSGEIQSPFSAVVRAQIVTGIVIQLLGWWLEEESGYTAAEMAHLIKEVLFHGIGELQIQDVEAA